jgi:hypothetical protein|tara:strand:- start:419 stop:709 length:291 start_codon:yes stop_codon:yes gene_type:complete
MDEEEIGNDYDRQSQQKKEIEKKPVQKKGKKRIGAKKTASDEFSENSDIRMGGNSKPKQYRNKEQMEEDEENEILKNELNMNDEGDSCDENSIRYH